MQINLRELGTQAIESTTGSTKMRLSENAQSMVFQLFTKNVYSNPIGTVVREITSNCFDSHIEANVDAPVIIRKGYDKETNSYHISFIDYGVGMSPDRVYNTYGVYFESTKRVDNTQIGGWGIGGKTPLAYKRSTGNGEGEYDNSFYVITNYDNRRYYYMIYEGADTPIISLLHDEPTTERNGTEVHIPVLNSDMNTFAKEMVRQLYYFENVIFEGFEEESRYNAILTNDYQIIRGNTFLFRGNDYSDYVHVCLGRVAYPLDYTALGLSQGDYRLPIALKLEVGDIGVTVSRESLDYSESTIKMLKKKLEEAKDEVLQLIAKQYENIINLEQYFNVKNNFGMLNFDNGASIYVGNLIKQKDVDFSNFKYSFMKMPNDKTLFKLFFNVKTFGKKKTRSRYNNTEFEGGYEELKRNNNLLHVEEYFDRKVIKQAYLNFKYENYHIINKRDLTFNALRSEICEVFNVHLDKSVDDNGVPIQYIQDLITMQDEYFEIAKRESLDYDNLEIPQEFINDRKTNRGFGITKEMRNTTIPAKFFNIYSKSRIKLDELFKYEFPIFYGSPEDENSLKVAKEMFGLLFNNDLIVTTTDSNGKPVNGYSYRCKINGSIMFIMVSQVNVKYMKYCKNAYPVKDFYNKMLYRKTDVVLNYFRTYKLKERWDRIDNIYTYGDFGKIDAVWGNRIENTRRFVNSIPKSNLRSHTNDLSKFFNLNNIELFPEHKKIGVVLDEIEMLQEANRDILTHIQIAYLGSLYKESLIGILKKVMVL